jgi:60 kDa SS-A/Ro ribonucleoprotein
MYEKVYKSQNNSTGWNKLQKQAIANWYLNKNPKNLVYLVSKYKNRNGWTHADILRLSHIKYPDSLHDLLFKYITKGYKEYLDKLDYLLDTTGIHLTEELYESYQYIQDYIEGYEQLKTLEESKTLEAIELINKFKFVREHVPTQLLNSPEIWNALAQEMPMVAMLRNLNKLNSVKLFEKFPETKNKLITRLKSESDIKASKVHPLQILISLKMNGQNDGFDKDLKLALNTAFKHAFKNVEDIGKRFLIALDVSGSMSCNTVNGINCMTACEISCAMAMIIKSSQKSCDIMGFADTFRYLDLNPNDSLEKNLKKTNTQNFGRTDCSLPFTWSLENNKKYDAIIVFTDNETNANTRKPVDVLRLYRNKTGINCKLIVVATSTNDISIADRNEPMSMLDISGFSADTPMMINDFICL